MFHSTENFELPLQAPVLISDLIDDAGGFQMMILQVIYCIDHKEEIKK